LKIIWICFILLFCSCASRKTIRNELYKTVRQCVSLTKEEVDKELMYPGKPSDDDLVEYVRHSNYMMWKGHVFHCVEDKLHERND
jgi:hypothetical protein